MTQKVLFKSVFGSHLYGTNNANSDRDFKQIHQESLENIILKRDKSNVTKQSNSKTKNTSSDVDFESKELRQFIHDCLHGQTYALDLLFTPEVHWLETSDTWKEIVELRHKLVTKNIAPFLGYCRTQATIYSNKGNKYTEYLKVYGILSHANVSQKLKDVLEPDMFDNMDYVGIFDKHHSGKVESYLKVGQSEFPMTRQIADVLTSIKTKIDEYGDRTKGSSNGVDVKAFYHAFRVCWELEEILTTSKIVFPSAKVGHLLNIREAKFTREELITWLTSEIERVLEIPNVLPEPDFEFWDSWLLKQYLPH